MLVSIGRKRKREGRKAGKNAIKSKRREGKLKIKIMFPFISSSKGVYRSQRQ